MSDTGPRRCLHAYRRLIPVVPWSAPIWWVDVAHRNAQGKGCPCILPEGHERHTVEAQGRPCECVHGPRIPPEFRKEEFREEGFRELPEFRTEVQQRRRGVAIQHLIVAALLTILMLSIPFVWRPGDPSRLLFLILAVSYFIPTYVAIQRNHPEKTDILIFNALFGWAALAWIRALIWASRSRTRPALEESQRGSEASMTPTERRM
jgi:hypothetical protein